MADEQAKGSPEGPEGQEGGHQEEIWMPMKLAEARAELEAAARDEVAMMVGEVKILTDQVHALRGTLMAYMPRKEVDQLLNRRMEELGAMMEVLRADLEESQRATSAAILSSRRRQFRVWAFVVVAVPAGVSLLMWTLLITRVL